MSSALAAHVLLAMLFLGTRGGRLMAADGAGTDQGAMAVTLVSAAQLSASGSTPRRLDPLFAELDTGAPAIVLDRSAPPSGVLDLMRRLQTSEPGPVSNFEGRVPPPAEPRQGADEREALAAGAQASGRESAEEAGGAGGLWGIVAPCWRRLGANSRVPVTLEVELDVNGQLGRPPRIIRTDGSTGELRLQAEAQALAALSACLPRHSFQFAGRTFRLEFRPRR